MILIAAAAGRSHRLTSGLSRFAVVTIKQNCQLTSGGEVVTQLPYEATPHPRLGLVVGSAAPRLCIGYDTKE
jgi:hypothetical protein